MVFLMTLHFWVASTLENKLAKSSSGWAGMFAGVQGSQDGSPNHVIEALFFIEHRGILWSGKHLYFVIPFFEFEIAIPSLQEMSNYSGNIQSSEYFRNG